MGYSAIAEFSNMISGNAVTEMDKLEVNCSITPPLLITGKDVQLHTLEIKTLQIPLLIELGRLMINIAFEEV